jgi:hypothetical protein
METSMRQGRVLALDEAWMPLWWLSDEEAAGYLARGQAPWQSELVLRTLRGGTSSLTGELSRLDIPSMLVVGGSGASGLRHERVPPLSREGLFARDRNVCAYCGEKFEDKLLSKDHIHPVSRGGEDTWMNLVAACRACNGRKDDRRPEEAGMPLLYLPYEPNYHEGFILQNRRILADQMEFLAQRVSRVSRWRLS